MVPHIIKKFQNHPSIIKIIENHQGYFSFPTVELENVNREIDSLDASRAIQQNDIPVKLIKANCDIFSEFVIHNFNEGISTAKSPDILKSAKGKPEVKPVFKKTSRTGKENYRPVSILTVISKAFEKLIFMQLLMSFEPVFSKYHCGSQKGYSAQNCLLVMIEKWKKCLDINDVCDSLLTDLSKAFECLPHFLLTAKLHAHEVDKTSTEYLKDHLSHRKQRQKQTIHLATGLIYYIGNKTAPYCIHYYLIFNIFFCLYQTRT